MSAGSRSLAPLAPLLLAPCACSTAPDAVILTPPPAATESATLACQQVWLHDLVPEAARFPPGASVTLRASLAAEGADPCVAPLELEVTHLGEVVHRETLSLELSSGSAQARGLSFTPPPEDFRGYLARLYSSAGDEVATGVDVSSNPLVYPRYGYLSAFPPGQPAARSRELVSTLVEQYHLNAFQFYDWFWRHEDLLPAADAGAPAPSWRDLFGREQSLGTLRDLIAAVHDDNGLALAYVAMYAAREGYDAQSGVRREWGLFEDAAAERQVALPFGGERYLFLFDPLNPRWQAQMAGEYAQAIALGFDGVQIDQFGPRPTLYRAAGEPVELRDTFAPFLEAVDEALTRNDPSHAVCAFNLVDGSVDGYAVQAVAGTSACDLLYSEIWYATQTYDELRAYIEQLRAIGHGRSIVLAMYPQYGQEVGRRLEAEDATLAGVTVGDEHSGYSGGGYVDGFDEAGDALTFSVETEQDPTVTFVFRYANAAGEAATRTLLVDGVPAGKLRFGARERWDEWAFDAWLQQAVTPGRHDVQLARGPDDVGAVNIDRLTLGAFDEASMRLQNAVVFASGATPIQIGDDVQSLAHEYFPNRSKSLRAPLRRALRAQQTFITAHETLLFGRDVRPLPAPLERLSTVGGGPPLITTGSGGVWVLLRRAPAGDVIHLVNLVGVDNDLWRDPAPEPAARERLRLRYRPGDGGAVRQVLWASPDERSGAFAPLEFSASDGYIELEVPRLAYWDVVLIRREG